MEMELFDFKNTEFDGEDNQIFYDCVLKIGVFPQLARGDTYEAIRICTGDCGERASIAFYKKLFDTSPKYLFKLHFKIGELIL